MFRHEHIPHVENVELVPESRSHAGAPGFSFRFNLVLVVGLSALLLLSYLAFS